MGLPTATRQFTGALGEYLHVLAGLPGSLSTSTTIIFLHGPGSDTPQEPLAVFANRAYQTLQTVSQIAPPEAREFLRRFIDHDFISHYTTVRRAHVYCREFLQRKIAPRIPKRAIWLPNAVPDLIAADKDLEEDFSELLLNLWSSPDQARSRLSGNWCSIALSGQLEQSRIHPGPNLILILSKHVVSDRLDM